MPNKWLVSGLILLFSWSPKPTFSQLQWQDAGTFPAPIAAVFFTDESNGFVSTGNVPSTYKNSGNHEVMVMRGMPPEEGKLTLDISKLPGGIYEVLLDHYDKRFAVGKIVVVGK
jgi:hypothetical protein